MKLRSLRHIAYRLLVLACLSSAQFVYGQSTAGTVEFVSGQASIRSAAGQTRAAERGVALRSGDTIETASGRLQMRMVDGAYISLQPQSLLRLDEYFAGGSGAVEERGLLGLLRGGLRSVTGTIGRANRASYRLTTPTATVGIRGTEFAVTADNGTRVSVTEGLVALCNDGGCVDIGVGQSGFAPDRQSRPALSFAPARLPPAASVQPQSFVVAEQRSANGNSAALFDTGTSGISVVPVVPLPNGVGGLVAASVTTGGAFSAGLLGSTMSFSLGGALTQGIDCCTPTNNYTAGVSSDFGADGIIAWGRWTSGLGQNGQNLTTMNYISVLTANNVTAPTTSIVHAYTSFASTAPTVTSGGTLIAVGTPNSVTGTLNVNFANLTGGGSLTYMLSVPVPGQTFTINGTANQFSGTGFLGSSSTITSTGAGCSPSCAGIIPFGDAIQGVFTGAAAQRAGANYGFSAQIGKVSGAIVFK